MAVSGNKDAVAYILKSIEDPLFQIPVSTFIEQHCENFFSEDDPSYREFHEQYRQIVTASLDAFKHDAQMSDATFLSALQQVVATPKHDENYELVKHLIAVERYSLFVELMVQKNTELQEHALETLLNKHDRLPDAFDLSKVGLAGHTRDDDEQLQRALRESREEYEREQNSLRMEAALLSQSFSRHEENLVPSFARPQRSVDSDSGRAREDERETRPPTRQSQRSGDSDADRRVREDEREARPPTRQSQRSGDYDADRRVKEDEREARPPTRQSQRSGDYDADRRVREDEREARPPTRQSQRSGDTGSGSDQRVRDNERESEYKRQSNSERRGSYVDSAQERELERRKEQELRERMKESQSKKKSLVFDGVEFDPTAVRVERGRLLRENQEDREALLERETQKAAKQRPKSSRVARKAMLLATSNNDSSEDDKDVRKSNARYQAATQRYSLPPEPSVKLIANDREDVIRKAIAARLKQEVIKK